MLRSFSLIEIIFTIIIISIITVVAIPKLFYNIDTANIIKLRADVALIRDKINSFKSKQILTNNNDQLTTLENIMTSLLTINHTGGSWSKISTNNYQAWVDSKNVVKFIYDPDTFCFDCNINIDKYCEQLTQ
ncbi:hypothetical protein MNB_ARC-1_760 [hydrothermal vent metagenome]|uniref:Uncharacterized protein n=1 Tax=hydrothermal vent metagenome TaxID=652676 RepID=A0A3B1E5M6_9ZZZZ